MHISIVAVSIVGPPPKLPLGMQTTINCGVGQADRNKGCKLGSWTSQYLAVCGSNIVSSDGICKRTTAGMARQGCDSLVYDLNGNLEFDTVPIRKNSDPRAG